MGLMSYIACKKTLAFVGGVAAGLLLPVAMKSKTARKVAVTITAKGMQLKDDVRTAMETIKEDAQDIYAEAKAQGQPAE